MKYYGFTINYVRYYYQCLTCHKFTEYHITSKKLVLVELSPLVTFAAMIAIYSLVADSRPLLALFLSLGSILLFFALSYKHKWSYFEIIPLDKLPDRLILPAASKKVGLIIKVLFGAVFMGYFSLILFNTIRK